MTSKEAVNHLNKDIYRYVDFSDNPNEDEFWEAYDMAINALGTKEKILNQLKILEKFNNSDVPEWVINVIKGA